MNSIQPSTLSIMGYEVYSDNEGLKLDLSKKTIINTINPHSYCVAKNDMLFRKALVQSDILIPDGVGIVIAARFLHLKRIKKIAGADLHLLLLEKLNEIKGSCFYLGSASSTLALIEEKVKIQYPNITIDSYSPPFAANFSQVENDQMVEIINNFNPDVLFVGMTAPKQEKWLLEHSDQLNVTISCSIGAVFDFYAGTIKRSNKIWINLGLEWLPRLIQEPKRLWRRNFISTPIFLFDMFKWAILRRR